MITNTFSAEFGRAAGAVINASIKSGSNQYHGSGWIYNRNASLAANKWENNWRALDKDDLKWNQPGGTLGGPIRRDKLFFFGDYEGFFSTGDQRAVRHRADAGPAQRRFQRAYGPDSRPGHGPAVPGQHHSRQPLRSAGEENPRRGLSRAQQRLADAWSRRPADQQLHRPRAHDARHAQVGRAGRLQPLGERSILRALQFQPGLQLQDTDDAGTG